MEHLKIWEVLHNAGLSFAFIEEKTQTMLKLFSDCGIVSEENIQKLREEAANWMIGEMLSETS